MNVSTKTRLTIYLVVLFGLSLLLIREYTYIHPYNPGWGWFGPGWVYTSTKTPTWWLLLLASLISMTPLLKKQKIGFFGLAFFVAVIIRPIVQNQFPQETVFKYYSDRKEVLNVIVSQTEIKNQTISNKRIEKLGFEELVVKDSVFYFFCFDEDYPMGICYLANKNLPKDTLIFGMKFFFRKIEDDWYEISR